MGSGHLIRRRRALGLGAVLTLWAALTGCGHSRYRGPSLLATAGAVLSTGGALTYAVGDRKSHDAMTESGAVMLGTGLALVIAAGVWAAVRAQCESSADCGEAEYCQTLYTTAGAYGHCLSR